jgi:hypothetical protein
MHTAKSLDGRPISIRYSTGSAVPYLEDWEDNVLRPPENEAWPASLLKQVKGYVARKEWFTADDADALAARLGRISEFQSINPDAVTWSWFGTLSCAAPKTRRRSEIAYRRLVADWQASGPKVGAGATPGRPSSRPSMRQAGRQTR